MQQRWFPRQGFVVVVAGLIGASMLVTTALGAEPSQQNHGDDTKDFGIEKPLSESSKDSITKEVALADPRKLVSLAGSLKAQVVATVPEAPVIDQMALWPNDNAPTHLIACNEEEDQEVALLRISLADGSSETIVKSGLISCDPVRRTAWGTIIFGEENDADGRLFELIKPLDTRNVEFDGTAFSGGTHPENLVERTALGNLSFEGLAVYANGLIYYGDENRPSSGTPGGAYFKFVPTHPYNGSTPISSLNDSPLMAGQIFGLRLGKRSGNTDYGQGTESGFGTWIAIGSLNLRSQAATLKLTGYYRPEDIDIDRAAERKGEVRFCDPNTGNESDDQLWGEVICITDGTIAAAIANTAKPEVQLFVQGSPALAMPDNIAYQPGRGNWIIHEDADTEYLKPHNNDLWDCLPDGDDFDLMTDGCIRIGTLNDLTAEWTGGIFDASGKHFYVSVQHNISGKGTILDITGWK